MAVVFLLNTPQQDTSYILDAVLTQASRETDELKTARIFISGSVCVRERKKIGRKQKSDGRVTRQREKPNAGKERGTLPGHPWHMRRPSQRSPQRTQGATLLSALPGSGAKLLTGGRTWAQTMLGFREPVGPYMLGPHKWLSAKCGHQRACIFVPLQWVILGKEPYASPFLPTLLFTMSERLQILRCGWRWLCSLGKFSWAQLIAGTQDSCFDQLQEV